MGRQVPRGFRGHRGWWAGVYTSIYGNFNVRKSWLSIQFVFSPQFSDRPWPPAGPGVSEGEMVIDASCSLKNFDGWSVEPHVAEDEAIFLQKAKDALQFRWAQLDVSPAGSCWSSVGCWSAGYQSLPAMDSGFWLTHSFVWLESLE